MEGISLDGVVCPVCAFPAEAGRDGTRFRCPNCQVELDFKSALCSSCNHLNLAGRRLCVQCGAPLVRACPACRHENWAGNDHCDACGQLLDMLEIMTQPRVRDTVSRLRAQQHEAQSIKQVETYQSTARLAEFWQQEEQRLKIEFERSVLNTKREKRLVLVAALAAVLLLAILLVHTLVVN